MNDPNNSQPDASPERPRVLLVDDDEDLADVLAVDLAERGLDVEVANDLAAATELATTQEFSLVLTDLRLAGDDGLDLCREVSARRPNVPVVVITGHGSLDVAVKAIRAGAYDFITKPVDGRDLDVTVERALRHHNLVDELTRLREAEGRRRPLSNLIGDSEAMKRVASLVRRVADTEASVLIEGESGTGKELVARALHDGSSRSDGPFVAINCGAVASSILESELFGHVRGAFTDAKRDRPGLFLEANGGTLFLDEIGEMPAEMQTKLLRVLQERRVRPVGGQTEKPFDTRVIAATNRDLEQEVEERRFREDLYYRINVVHVPLPPLRRRGNDILMLAQHFLEESAQRAGRPVVGLSTEAAAKLLEYRWPGNVRQLQNCMERAVTLARYDKITVDDLPDKIQRFDSQSMALELDEEHFLPWAEMERRYIERALKLADGNKTRAAELLGLDRRTVYRKLERFAEQDS